MASLGEELLNVVNRLQDLVFNTIGNDSLDLPQIVRVTPLALGRAWQKSWLHSAHSLPWYLVPSVLTRAGCRRIAISRKVVGP
jgi:hypothetical protein